MMVQVLAAPLAIQVLVNVPGIAVEHGPSAWASEPTWKTLTKLLASAGPSPDQAIRRVNQQMEDLSLSLSLCRSAFQVNKIIFLKIPQNWNFVLLLLFLPFLFYPQPTKPLQQHFNLCFYTLTSLDFSDRHNPISATSLYDLASCPKNSSVILQVRGFIPFLKVEKLY